MQMEIFLSDRSSRQRDPICLPCPLPPGGVRRSTYRRQRRWLQRYDSSANRFLLRYERQHRSESGATMPDGLQNAGWPAATV